MSNSISNSALRTPLNEILGSKSHIHILRYLTRINHSTSHSEIAKQTGLSRQGVYNAVSNLTEIGITEYIGTGTKQQVQLREKHPFSNEIKRLFDEEKVYFTSLIECFKEEISSVQQQIKSAWIFGKVAQQKDEYGDPLQIAILADVKTVDNVKHNFWNRIKESNIEQKYDVTIEVKGVTIADLKSIEELYNSIILLWGPGPKSYLENESSESLKDHRELDLKSAIYGKAFSKLISLNPDLIERTVTYLENKIPKIKSGEKEELQEWQHLLKTMPRPRLGKFLKSESERAVRLRQSNPFFQVLTGQEREQLEMIKAELENES